MTTCLNQAVTCSHYEDVATPVLDAQNNCNCTTQGPDGYIDLALKFDTQEIVKAIGDCSDGELLQLVLTGRLTDGKKIEGPDCVRIMEKELKDHKCPHYNKKGCPKEWSHHKKECPHYNCNHNKKGR